MFKSKSVSYTHLDVYKRQVAEELYQELNMFIRTIPKELGISVQQQNMIKSNITIVLRIYLIILLTFAAAERSFPLTIIFDQSCLEGSFFTSNLSIESDISSKVDFSDVIDITTINIRRSVLYGIYILYTYYVYIYDVRYFNCLLYTSRCV